MALRRPILKGLSAGESSQPGVSCQRGHVHFPPTPEISATFIAHSSRTYDRSAIVVSPNVCSLPKRHCPDRTYVLTEGKGEALLLKSVQLKDVQNEEDDDDDDDTPSHTEYDQGAVWMDYFSIPSPLSTAEMPWPESDDTDDLVSLSEITLSCDHSQLPILDLPVHDVHNRGMSESHGDVQATLSFLSHPPPPAVERRCNVSLRDSEKQDKAHSLSGGEGSRASSNCSRRPRRASSFNVDVRPDSGCLGGF